MQLLLIFTAILIIEVSYLVFKSWSAQRPGRSKSSVFVDTSALMDGRIVTAAQAGFIPSDITIPRSVINELQLLADQADAEKRSRARRGLDAISEMQELKYLNVNIIDDGVTGSGGVDQRLVDLAKRSGGSICTIDFNLNKVATVQGIQVLNINELAGGIRMAFLPGETISLGLTQKGQSSSQAVGYLADGTMVVVDKASGSIGQTVQIEFIRSLQTAAGRMMFAKLIKPAEAPAASAKGRTAVTSEEQSNATSTPRPKRRAASSRQSSPATTRERSSDEITAEKVPHVAATRPTATPNSQRRRRRSGEDSLLELVDRQ